jgi:hypothetical protein
MWKEKYETLETEYKNLSEGHDALLDLHRDVVEAHDALAARVRKMEAADRKRPHRALLAADGGTTDVELLPSVNKLPANGDAAHYDLNVIYDEIKHRAKNDPGILQLLAARPELRVQIERPVLEVDGKTLRGGLALLLHKGFFSAPKNGNTTFNELQRLGRKTAKPNVYRELDNLAELGFLTKEPDGYQATDLKVTVGK